MDLGNLSSLEGKVQDIWDDFGPIDILVNNAGISHRYRAQEASLEIDQKILAVNFFGTIALAKPTLKRMLDRGRGQIVCVSSLVGFIGVKYSASKHALRGYFESLRHELHQSPIKITMVYPGYINTNMPQNALLKSGLPNATQEKTHIGGMKAEDCASQIVKAIEKELPEIIVARPLERIAVFVSRHLPGLFRWLFPRLYR